MSPRAASTASLALALLLATSAHAELDLGLTTHLGTPVPSRSPDPLLSQLVGAEAAWHVGAHAAGLRLSVRGIWARHFGQLTGDEHEVAALVYRRELQWGELGGTFGVELERFRFAVASVDASVELKAIGDFELRLGGGLAFQSATVIESNPGFSPLRGPIVSPFAGLAVRWRSGHGPGKAEKRGDSGVGLIVDGVVGLAPKPILDLDVASEGAFGVRYVWKRHAVGLELRALQYQEFAVMPMVAYQRRFATDAGRLLWLEVAVGPTLLAPKSPECRQCVHGNWWAGTLGAGVELAEYGPVSLDLFGGAAIFGDEGGPDEGGPRIGLRASWLRP